MIESEYGKIQVKSGTTVRITQVDADETGYDTILIEKSLIAMLIDELKKEAL